METLNSENTDFSNVQNVLRVNKKTKMKQEKLPIENTINMYLNKKQARNMDVVPQNPMKILKPTISNYEREAQLKRQNDYDKFIFGAKKDSNNLNDNTSNNIHKNQSNMMANNEKVSLAQVSNTAETPGWIDQFDEEITEHGNGLLFDDFYDDSSMSDQSWASALCQK